MSNQALTWAFEQNGLPCKAKFVLVSIANHADHTDGYCWLKVSTIAQEAAIPERSLYRYLGGLMRNGYLRREKRKGADGKQRANDYWILFDRKQAPWDWGAVAGGDDDADPQDVVEPTAIVAVGESEMAVGDEGEKTPDMAVGPTAIGGSGKDSDEPPKTNPEKKEGASRFASPPRGYKAPPIAPEPPQGALHPDASKPIFVFFGSRAWKAWVKYKKRTTGRDWSLTTTITIDGERKAGWHFPTLFPPDCEEESESSEEESMARPP